MSSSIRVESVELAELGGGLLGHRVDFAVEAVDPVDQRLHLARRRDDGHDLGAGHGADVVGREDVRRVGHRHHEATLLVVVDRDRLVAPDERLRHEHRHRGVDEDVVEIDEAQPDLARRASARGRARRSDPARSGSGRAACRCSACTRERRVEVGLSDQTLVQEQRAELGTVGQLASSAVRARSPRTRFVLAIDPALSPLHRSLVLQSGEHSEQFTPIHHDLRALGLGAADVGRHGRLRGPVPGCSGRPSRRATRARGRGRRDRRPGSSSRCRRRRPAPRRRASRRRAASAAPGRRRRTADGSGRPTVTSSAASSDGRSRSASARAVASARSASTTTRTAPARTSVRTSGATATRLTPARRASSRIEAVPSICSSTRKPRWVSVIDVGRDLAGAHQDRLEALDRGHDRRPLAGDPAGRLEHGGDRRPRAAPATAA